MNIVGLSAGYHESACCLLRDGLLVAAAEEERFSRQKHDPRLPLAAWRFCLEQGRLGIRDLDALAYYESPTKKLARQLWAGQARLADLDTGRVERDLRERLIARTGAVTLSVNGQRLAAFRLATSWRQRTHLAGRSLLRPGINRVCLQWPMPVGAGDAALAQAADRLRLGIPADLYPVFGEVFSLRATVRGSGAPPARLAHRRSKSAPP